jgi:dipeptidyl aminopeptidase/acylaminoacyl peptidase
MERVDTRIHALAEEIFSLRSESMPTWIDDSRFAFLDDRSGVPNLFVAEAQGDSRRQVTSGDERVQSLIAGADGTVIVGTDVGGNERQQLRSIRIGDGSGTALTTNPDQMFEPFLVSPDGTEVLYRTNDGQSGEFSLWAHCLDSGERTCLWEDAGQVRAHDMNPHGGVLASLLTSNMDADLYIVGRDGSRQPILQAADESWILDAAFAPALEGVLVLTNVGRDFVGLDLIDLNTGDRTTLIDADGDVETFKVAPDGKRLVWSVNEAGYSRVYVADTSTLANAQHIQLPEGLVDRFSWSPDGEHLLLGWLPATSPSRIYIVDNGGSGRQILPDLADDRQFEGVAPETISYQTFDGRDIPAFWFAAGQGDRSPVVIDVHGGPESQRRPGFHPVLQYLVACGFNVLTTNVRGSTGYGKEYAHLDDVDLRLDSVRDLESAHRWILAQSPAFADRVAVMGQSYGGFMTLSAITEYPDLWFAAVDVVGICNFVTFLERTGAYRRRHREAEYGSLDRDRELLTTISPIRKVDEITAPLLVIHGKNDPRVPLYEAQQLVALLEARDHPVQSLVYDNEGHGLSKRDNRIGGYAQAVEFLWSVAEPQRES